MARCTITPQAQRDLQEIWLFIASDNPAAADRLVDNLLATAHLIAESPEMGVARPDLAEGVRGFPCERRYVIFYRIVSGGIEVLHIVHGARNLRLLSFGD